MKGVKGVTTWLFNIRKVQAAFAGIGKPFYERLLVSTGEAELARLAVDVAFDVHQPEIARFIKTWNGKFSKSVTQHTYDSLRGTLTAGMDAGENMGQLRKRVQATMEIKRANDAERIARSETARAAEGGRFEAMRQSGVVKGREWVASSDACEFCLSLTGTRVMNLEKPFVDEGGVVRGVDGGELVSDYGPMMYPPAHPNCACTVLEVMA